MEVYINDIVIKTRIRFKHLLHLEEAFNLMCKYDMKLNMLKRAFRVSARKFLGFMVTQRGIKVNPAQFKSVLETPTPTSKKEMKHLSSQLVVLGPFIARFIDKLWTFFNMLQRAKISGWMNECEHAFEAIKWYLVEPPILSNLEAGEELYMYLAVLDLAINSILFQHNQSNEQRPIYYMSKALIDVEIWYSQVEQTTLALQIAAKNFCPYFQAHQITVLTNQPLRVTLHKTNLSRQMMK